MASFDTNVTDVVVKTSSFSGLISYEVREIVCVINFVFLGEIIGVLGIVGNVINIVVFSKHGFQDTVNISLVGLAVGDLGSLITLQWFNICVNPWFVDADLPFYPLEIQSLTAGYTHNYFTRVTGFITAFVTFERCLCVAVPFKVKRIMTRRVAIAFNIGIYFILILSIFPVYYTAYYDWKFDEARNKSRLGIFYTSNKDEVLGYSLFITNFFVPLSSFVVVIISTIIIAVKLKSKASWRRKSASAAPVGTGDDVSTKETRVVIMITTVSVIFIICFIPMTLVLTARALVPGLSIIGKYANMNWTVISIAFLMETINSSINIVVYYKMSTKFRDTCNEILPCFNREVDKDMPTKTSIT